MNEHAQYSIEELKSLGLAEVGEGVLVDRTCRFYGVEHIRIGSKSRLDAYCVLSSGESGISIGRHVHLSVGATILGGGGVFIEDFAGLSARVSVFSSNDDYSGGAMTNPTIPMKYREVKSSEVRICRHAIIGCGSVLLPGVTLGVGASVGALSLVNKSVPDFMVVAGNPMRRIGRRDRRLLEQEVLFLSESNQKECYEDKV